MQSKRYSLFKMHFCNLCFAHRVEWQMSKVRRCQFRLLIKGNKDRDLVASSIEKIDSSTFVIISLFSISTFNMSLAFYKPIYVSNGTAPGVCRSKDPLSVWYIRFLMLSINLSFIAKPEHWQCLEISGTIILLPRTDQSDKKGCSHLQSYIRVCDSLDLRRVFHVCQSPSWHQRTIHNKQGT